MQAQLLGQRTDTRADLQHTHILVHPGLAGDGLRNPGSNQKILPLGLGKMEAVLRQEGLHHMNITNINHKTPQKECLFSVMIAENRLICNMH